jgi:hypothetical protein
MPDLISIKGPHTKLWGPKIVKPQLKEFRDSHLGVLGQNAIWIWASWRGTKYTIREGEGAGFPQVRAVMNLVSSSLPVACPSTERAPTMHLTTSCLVLCRFV